MAFYTPFAYRKSSAVAAATDIIQTNLVRYYDAGNSTSYGGSGTTWTDLMSSGYNLTLTNGPTFTSDGAGSYFTFDGSDDFATGDDTGLPSGSAGDISVGIWIYPLTGNDFKTVWGIGNTGQFNQQLALFQVTGYTDSPTFQINVYGPWVPGTLGVAGVVSTNAWHYHVFTYDGSNFAYYIDNVQTETGTTTAISTVLRGAGGLKLADWDDAPAFNCRIGNFHIYNVALSSGDVTTNWNNTKARYGL